MVKLATMAATAVWRLPSGNRQPGCSPKQAACPYLPSLVQRQESKGEVGVAQSGRWTLPKARSGPFWPPQTLQGAGLNEVRPAPLRSMTRRQEASLEAFQERLDSPSSGTV